MRRIGGENLASRQEEILAKIQVKQSSTQSAVLLKKTEKLYTAGKFMRVGQ